MSTVGIGLDESLLEAPYTAIIIQEIQDHDIGAHLFRLLPYIRPNIMPLKGSRFIRTIVKLLVSPFSCRIRYITPLRSFHYGSYTFQSPWDYEDKDGGKSGATSGAPTIWGTYNGYIGVI